LPQVLTTPRNFVPKRLVVFPVFATDQITQAIAQQETIALQLAFNASPLTGRDVLTENVDGLLTTDTTLVNEVTGFVTDRLDGIGQNSGGLNHDINTLKAGQGEQDKYLNENRVTPAIDGWTIST